MEWLVGTFAEKHAQVLQAGLTTAQVVFEIIKPATEAEQCRFTDLMLHDSQQAAAVSGGREFYFISHGWARPFRELVDQLKRHFDPAAQLQRSGRVLEWCDVFVWLDIFGGL